MQYLPVSTLFLLISSFVLGACSATLFSFGNKKAALLTLVLASGVIAYVFASVDPFLHLWDEQFHALVSKNLLHHPFKPTLYDQPALPYDYHVWQSNYIWLHKQPLFLWQMAISQSILGINEIGVRFPDVMLHALLTFLIYDLGRMFKNERVGFLAAFIFTFLNFPLELISANIELDHNDVSFAFYVTASFWALARFREKGRFGWVLLVGLFSGCAILVKWLPGLLVYLSWGILYISENFKERKLLKNAKPLLTSFIITLLVFIPWQIYCLVTFPMEFKQEMHYNSLHLTHAVEGHTGDWTFHFAALSRLYGEGAAVPFLLLAALIFTFFDKKTTHANKIIFISAILFVYAFFSIVATKMLAFPFLVLPLTLILLANLFITLIDFIRNKVTQQIALTILCLGCGFLFLDLNRFLKSHTLFYKPEENNERYKDILEAKAMRELKKETDNNTVLFNAGPLNLRLMFYTDATAYPSIPSEQERQIIKQEGKKIVVLDRGDLPREIMGDSGLVKIPFPKY
jgi:4-amino-4-deoxy-L-arabinose transferase